ncbi:FapA family protein [Deferribacter desulfuricans]|uniref:FapA family protein n=1 Tax=Deferribacter desulfuricans TaxID=197162 RepID=UPI0038B4033B
MKGLLLIKHVDNLTYELDISDIFVVNKNVDYSTGNIDFPGSVIIKGEVKAEFTVKAGKDVIAKSVSGNVITDGKLIVKEGITGRSFANRNIIKAEELEASYIQFSNITVDKNVQVKKYIRDSIIYCEGKVEVTGTPGMIYGGKVNALEGITVKILGSPSFTKTVVSTGISTKVLNEISTLVAEKSALNEQLTKINLYLGNADRPIIRDRLKEKIKKLKEAKLEINKKLIKIEVKLKELYEEVQKFKGSKIEVLKEAYPNVKVIIGEATLLLEKKLRNGYFFYNKEKKAIDYMLK